MHFLKTIFTGGVDQNGPLRFLIETMLAAIAADGDVTEAEVETLHTTVGEHELFRELSYDASTQIIHIAAKAIRHHGGGIHRVQAIAQGLPTRTHRQTAYALACEVSAADGNIPTSELGFLAALQSALKLDDTTANEIFTATANAHGLKAVEKKLESMHSLVPHFIGCMALMAIADGVIGDDELISLRAIVLQIPDLSTMNNNELNEVIVSAFDHANSMNPDTAIREAANAIVAPVDRYWTAIYMMMICVSDGTTDWHCIPLLHRVRDAFGLTDELMDQAMKTAQFLPVSELAAGSPPTQIAPVAP